jgi:hypothetical protein
VDGEMKFELLDFFGFVGAQTVKWLSDVALTGP